MKKLLFLLLFIAISGTAALQAQAVDSSKLNSLEGKVEKQERIEAKMQKKLERRQKRMEKQERKLSSAEKKKNKGQNKLEKEERRLRKQQAQSTQTSAS